MKYLCVAVLLLFAETAFAQKKEKETTVPCIAYWKKGEEKTYLLTRTRRKSGGKNADADNFLMDAKITVLDSSAQGYTIRWIWAVPSEIEKNSPLGQGLALVAGRKFIYKTDNYGSFTELVNWEEVRDAYTNLARRQHEARGDSAKKKALEQAVAYFTKEKVESIMIREIELFHVPFGMIFSTKDTTLNAAMPVPGIDSPLPAIQGWRITEVGPGKGDFRLAITQYTDPVGAAKVIDSTINKLSAEGKINAEQVRKSLTPLRVDDFSEYKFIQPTGWLKEYTVTRTMVTGDVTQTETYKMELRYK